MKKFALVSSILAVVMLMAACTKDTTVGGDLNLNPGTTTSSNGNSGESGSGSVTPPSAIGGESQPEGAISYNLGTTGSVNIPLKGLHFTLSLDNMYNFNVKNYNYNGYEGGYASIVNMGAMKGLNALNTSKLPDVGWSTSMSCDSGHVYIVKVQYENEYNSMYNGLVAIYVSTVFSGGAQIWYCPFSTSGGFNK